MSEFLNENGDHDFESVNQVHPLFKFLQNNFDPSSRFKNQANSNWDKQSIFPVPQIKTEENTIKKFYRYFLT